MQLKRKLKQERREYLIKSIESLKEENTRQLFSQFKSMNSNKISVIPTLIEPTSGTIAKIDKEKAEMLVLWFSQPHNHQVILKKQKNIINWWKMKLKNDCYPLWDEYRQMDVTKDEVVEALRYISSHKAQGLDNIHNQMTKNGGQELICSLIDYLIGASRLGMFQDYGKKQTLYLSQNQTRPQHLQNYSRLQRKLNA
ncbi:hypothetical protein RFI_26772 [Reticulomyxa filosa]|uniref:Uncharacterized protein n=1 Tax=Reticulomyxa filosa TaxID=46433 RepID=X6MAW1_RETFI|nr:hypothetical protein RFI_26772 [Reticulomyxa filosa]|eukprot:ETO10607.1 hypothetical protein RFI_26772 [Reticulomyxa filosa]